MSSKEISDFERRCIWCIRTVSAIVSDAGPEIATNRPWRCLSRVGGAHGVAPLQDCALGFKSEDNNLAGTHKLGQFSEEAPFAVHSIKTFGLFSRESHRFDCNYLKPSFVDARQYFPGQPSTDCVWFYNCKSAFDCHSQFLHDGGISALNSCLPPV